jgi:hypothetical protein
MYIYSIANIQTQTNFHIIFKSILENLDVHSRRAYSLCLKLVCVLGIVKVKLFKV